MSSTGRFLLDVLILLLAAGLVYGVWTWQEGRRNRELAQAAEAHAAEATDLRAKAEFWADALAEGEARAVFRAFLAGVAPHVLAGRNDSVEMAAVTLLGLPGIDFVHVLRPGGEVLYSSDAKLATAGTAGEAGAWALSTMDLATRASATRGVTEVAAPISGPDGLAAYLWLGYRTERIREEVRPETLKPPPAGPQPEPPTEPAG